ncbi:alpha-mannosidase [Cohnella herbarum]|uniref:Alpha-mannosidase n=1 Tax=Cohnella herbarum TaxID=2728023 RepID=A0A7Z2VNV5_9BACL|nr:alpha-mannosidase [Cohnella herbarum]QJD86461.1 alpha-mannosidase [Cohnella herbarum]
MIEPVAHIISHTHWDREWYMPYEKHHVRLIALMDVLLDTLDKDDDFRSFHLDGQTIILEDYLQVRPEQRERLTHWIRQGRIVIGPWYILQDEFLTSAEANVRNLLIGHHDAKAYGPVAKIGYFPDSFGNMGQAPQLLLQAGIRNAVFGRGVKPTGSNNTVSDSAAYESPFSEMTWRSPDGSEVLGILFANWYHNGMEIPVKEEDALSYWPERMANTERYASTPQLLFMNGCDHQPVQTDLSAALETARKLYPGYRFKHSTFADYIAAVETAIDKPLTVVEGELRSQRTDGWGTLVNTASARVYIKQANTRGQILLEKIAEPAAAIAAHLGRGYPDHLLTYAWKTLMQNHPHDSICGCSVDEVHSEMMTRFAKSRHVAESLAQTSLKFMASHADTSLFSDPAIPFLVMNYAGQIRSGTVSVELEIEKRSLQYSSSVEIYEQLDKVEIGDGLIVDEKGRIVEAEIEDLGVKFNYALPDEHFRKPYIARRLRITLKADRVPGLGYRVYAWRREPGLSREGRANPDIAPLGKAALENEFYSIIVNRNGSLTLTDKETQAVYSNLCVYEDVGDIGNEYIFKQDGGMQALTTQDLEAEVRILSKNSFVTVVEIIHRWEIPAEAEATLQREMASMVPVRDRNSLRSQRTVPIVIRTLVTIEQGARALKVVASFDNQAKDHRIRALFPSDIVSDVHYADSIFEIAERPNEPAPEWLNPSNAQHQQAFVALDDIERGLAIANIGLNEYEILRDGRNTIAVTLLRSVGELGDWGVFPTPEAQCLGKHEVEFAIIPYAGQAKRSEVAKEAYSFQIPWASVQTEIQQGILPPVHGWLDWSGKHLAFSTVKGREKYGEFIVRWYNLSNEHTELILSPSKESSEWYASNILEERLRSLQPEADGKLRVQVKPCEIVTLLLNRL